MARASLERQTTPQTNPHILNLPLFFLLAAVIPLFLVIMFEVAYAVHKRRSVKFCGIVFDVR